MKKEFNLIWNGYTVCPETWGMTDTCETFHRIYYVYAGEAFYSCQGKEIPLKPNHLYLFPVFQPYSMRHNPRKPLDVLWFHAEMDLRLCEQITELRIEPGSILFHLLEALRLLSNRQEHFDHLCELFGVFLQILRENVCALPPLGVEMKKILNYIDGHIDQPFDVADLARYAKMERSYFCRKFKKVFKLPPSQYIIAARMKQATKVLLSGSTVYGAALACGYHDEKAFSRAFKQYMEIPPAKYRNERMILP